MEVVTKNQRETKKLGKAVAEKILTRKIKKRIIVLKGELGSGKTTFIKGFAQGLGIKEKILSPTFVLIRKFQIPNSKFQTFYHIDCYRIEKTREILSLNFKEIISNPQNIVAIEWGEKIKKILPKKAIWIKLGFLNSKFRRIKIKFK